MRFSHSYASGNGKLPRYVLKMRFGLFVTNYECLKIGSTGLELSFRQIAAKQLVPKPNLIVRRQNI